ncbi:hypothetical protein FZEAL_5347 [Fusarium zealandicum]|uniref:Glycosyl transferase CAP10 domain-containing protein n=1 Tax=Fusarium zealandicum TaxID=1053134 RepID=A0A8H4UKP0_9HYPO|nr:hypothetical protein FZEAL_5347 [Fusarium zealandicum]
MQKSYLNAIDQVGGLAGAAVLCTTLSQHLASRRSELCSELVCWLVLPVLFRYSKRSKPATDPAVAPFSGAGAQTLSWRSQWIVAAGIAVTCLYKAESRALGLFPTLTPLLIAVQRYFGCGLPASTPSDSWLFNPIITTIWGASSVALVAVLSLSNGDLWGSAPSVILVAASLIVYVGLGSKPKKGIQDTSFLDIEAIITLLAAKTVVFLIAALCGQVFLLGFLDSPVASTVLLGLAKALSWYFTIQTAQHTSWSIATTIGTFSIAATSNPFMQSSEACALGHVVVSFLTLGQTVHLLPKQAKTRILIWTPFFISLLPYVSNLLTIRSVHSSAAQAFPGSLTHPVEALVREAKLEFEHVLGNQSESYTAASDEYRQRYRVEPPPGFEAWYDFARSHQSPIIDEFDMIYDAISPLWSLSGKEVLEMMSKVQKTPQSEVWLCEFSGSRAETKCTHPYRSFDRHISLLFDTLLGDLKGKLPDVRFLVNHFDEPRVLIPLQSSSKDSTEHKRIRQTDMSKEAPWDMLTKACPDSKRDVGSSTEGPTMETYDLPFIKNHSSAVDLCGHPEYSQLHGFLMSPKTFWPIEGLIPILSTGSLSTMGDILFPSPAYIESEFQYEDSHDVDWESKRNNLYWAGSTTGGFALDDKWQNFHRQRFVSLSQNLEHREHHYLRDQNGFVNRVKSSFLNSRLFDVAFSRIFQCEGRHCRDQSTHFNTKSWADKDAALRSRLVYDTDGNGISGRYYKLLASKSVPLKQTLFREWHDERLMPWVHYIPVSQSLRELPELVSYLTSTESGQEIAREIADRGRNWFAEAFREVDMSIYVYRLLLELARLQDSNREASQ